MKHKLKLIYRELDIEVPDDLNKQEQELFIKSKTRLPFYVWYMNVDGIKFTQEEAAEAIDFEFNVKNSFGFEELTLETSKFLYDMLGYGDYGIGSRLSMCLIYDKDILSKMLFIEEEERLINVIKNRLGQKKGLLII